MGIKCEVNDRHWGSKSMSGKLAGSGTGREILGSSTALPFCHFEQSKKSS